MRASSRLGGSIGAHNIACVNKETDFNAWVRGWCTGEFGDTKWHTFLRVGLPLYDEQAFDAGGNCPGHEFPDVCVHIVINIHAEKPWSQGYVGLYNALVETVLICLEIFHGVVWGQRKVDMFNPRWSFFIEGRVCHQYLDKHYTGPSNRLEGRGTSITPKDQCGGHAQVWAIRIYKRCDRFRMDLYNLECSRCIVTSSEEVFEPVTFPEVI